MKGFHRRDAHRLQGPSPDGHRFRVHAPLNGFQQASVSNHFPVGEWLSDYEYCRSPITCITIHSSISLYLCFSLSLSLFKSSVFSVALLQVATPMRGFLVDFCALQQKLTLAELREFIGELFCRDQFKLGSLLQRSI